MVAVNAADPLSAKKYIRSLVQSARFDEREFLKETHGMATPDLLRAMRMIADELQQELGVLVNSEFEDFVKLFNEIGSMGEEEFQILEDKVQIIRQMTERISSAAEKEMHMLKGLLNKFAANLSEQKNIKLVAALANDLDRLEALSFNGDVATLEMATEFILKLSALINNASGKVPIPSWVVDRFASASSRYFSGLDDALLGCLRRGGHDMEGWRGLAQIYQRSGRYQMLVETYRNEAWQGELAKMLSRKRYEELAKRLTAARATETVFQEVYDSIKAAHSRWFTQLPSHEETTLFVDCVISPTFSTFARELSVIFSPALPDLFHSNFGASCKFVASITGLLMKHELIALNGDEAFQTYAKSWQLNVYYQLRFRDFSQRLEDSIAASKFDERPPQRAGDNMPIGCLDTLEAICRELCSPVIVLKPLVARFHRLRIHAIARISKWLLETSSHAEGGLSPWIAWKCCLGHGRLQHRVSASLLLDVSALQDYLGPEELCRIVLINQRFTEHLEESYAELVVCLKETLRTRLVTRAESWTPRVEQPATCLCDGLKEVFDASDLLDLGREFYSSTWLSVATSFKSRAEGLVGQTRKAAANSRRLRSIMKEQPADDGTDQETLQTVLYQAIRREARSLQDFAGEISASEDEACRALAELLTELGPEGPSAPSLG